MYNVLILLDSLSQWEPYLETKSIVKAADYLQNNFTEQNSTLVINLCSDLGYNSEGYYCSLLAQARGHKILPGAEVLNKLNSGGIPRLDRPLQKIIEQWIKKAEISSDLTYFDIYFGTTSEKGLERIARIIFDQLPCPILRVGINTKSKYHLESINTLKLEELSDQQQDLFADALDNFNKKIWRSPKHKKTFRYDLAIFHNPEEPLPPSNKKALQKFIELAKKMNVYAELITEEDVNRLMEFDALFIRQTTQLNHITYNLAQKASQADMVVMDDPLSIVKCTNKVYLKELLENEKVHVPKSLLLFKHDPLKFKEIESVLGSPFIIKMPDGSFSKGVKKIADKNEFDKTISSFFDLSSVLLLQEYMPTEFDWRIGILNGEPLFACKYYMARGHWQIYNHSNAGKYSSGVSETLPVYKVPKAVMKSALKAAGLIGKGLYGVDLKMVNDKGIVIEINDNPNIDHGVEDLILGDELYYSILREFIRRLDKMRM